MIGTTLLALGQYRFSVYTGGFYELQRESSWRWASQEVIGGNPRLQYIGPGDDTITIQGTIYPAYRGGLGQVNLMRAEAGGGQPLTLVDGTGNVLGSYVIERIGEVKTTFMSDGVPRKIDFVLSLKRYA